MPAPEGAMTARIVARNATQAKRAAVHWYTNEAHGTIDGKITVEETTLRPFWVAEDIYLWPALVQWAMRLVKAKNKYGS